MKKKDNEIKCHIVNEDVSIYEYELLDGVKTFQIEVIGFSKRRYVVANFSKLKEASLYLERMGALK